MSEFETSPEQSMSPKVKAIITFLVVILSVLSYLLYDKDAQLTACQAENNQLDSVIAEMNQMLAPIVGDQSDDLLTDFQNMISTYDALVEKDSTQSDSLNLQRSKIEGLVKELQTAKKNGKVNGQLIAKLRKENETLRQIMIGYVKQIDQLNTLNLKLTSELDETSTKLTDTRSERDQFRQEAETSKAKVAEGAKLKAYGFKSSGLRMKLNDTAEPTTKARNCVQAMSSFTIGENTLANSGNRVVYLQIIDPEGKALQGRSGGTTSTDAGAVVFSAKREIQYANKPIDVSIYFDFNGNEPVKGNYKVRIYCDGSMIGSDSFTLK
jgi:hypothetical protein